MTSTPSSGGCGSARVSRWPRCSARRRPPGLVFGVDLAARDSATVGGMASTNAGGLRTVRYGNMGEQVLGLDVALPDGSVVRRHSEVRRDNTGYDLASLFIGAEGTLGVITALDLRLHPTPAHACHGDRRLRRPRCADRRGPRVPRRRRHRRARADRRAGERADRRAPRRIRARRGCLAAADRTGRRHRPDRTPRRRARARRRWSASPQSASMPVPPTAALAGARGGRRGTRDVRPAVEVRCLAAAVE